jgi:hypothetical protein
VRPATVVALNALLVAGAMTVAAAAPRSGTVLVLTRPGWSAEATASVIVAAGGQFVTATGRDWAAVVRSDNPDFVGRLYAAGAMLVLDGQSLAGCMSER